MFTFIMNNHMFITIKYVFAREIGFTMINLYHCTAHW